MKNFFKTITIAALSISPAGLAFAQLANPAAMEVIAPEARSAGMADIGSATSPDVFSQHWNVAKYAFATEPAAIGLSYSLLSPNIDFTKNMIYAAGYYSLGKQTLSASFRCLTNGSSALSDEFGNAYGDVSLTQYAFDLGYSRAFGKYISLGIAARYLSLPRTETVGSAVYSSDRASAFATDLGFYFRYPTRKTGDEFALALSLKDIGTKVDMGGESKLFLPMTMYLGVRYTAIIPEKHALSFALEISKPLVPEDQTDKSVIGGLFSSFGNSIKEWGASAGVEYAYSQRFFARAGYHLGSKNYEYGAGSYLSIGGGMRWHNCALDLSYMLSTNGNTALTNSIRATLQYAFGAAK